MSARRLGIERNDLPEVGNGFVVLLHTDKHHREDGECLLIVLLDLERTASGLFSLRETRLIGENQGKINESLSVLRIVLGRLAEELLRFLSSSLLAIEHA